MRKFWLKDGGTEYSLQSDKLFFYAPTGLGISTEREYLSVENGFWIASGEKEAQVEIAGTLIFRKDPYKTYQEIADFIGNATCLELVYCPYGTEKYYLDISIDMMEKSELRIGVLEVPVQIHGISPWHTRNQMKIVTEQNVKNDIKRYGYRYPCRYTLTGTPGKTEFFVSGQFGGRIELKAPGPLTAPVFTVKDKATKEVYGLLDLSSISIARGETLYYSTLVDNAGIWKMDANEEKTDLTDAAELNPGIPLFMVIPSNRTVTAELAAGNASDTSFSLTVYEYWKTR